MVNQNFFTSKVKNLVVVFDDLFRTEFAHVRFCLKDFQSESCQVIDSGNASQFFGKLLVLRSAGWGFETNRIGKNSRKHQCCQFWFRDNAMFFHQVINNAVGRAPNFKSQKDRLAKIEIGFVVINDFDNLFFLKTSQALVSFVMIDQDNAIIGL
ncbi:hypothetical protein SDC9_167196 [bioreactor metagenome]|uniref:Uncharacterized protein n=1 Tax=bioreactor metagenome TaxID=1076179 RepID=A0A645G6T5_9ZZZZ